MKSTVGVLLLTLSLLGPSSFAASKKDDAMAAILASYLKIQKSLANDSLDEVQAEAGKIAKLSDEKQIKASALALSQDATLESARKDFKALSVPLDSWAKQAKPKGVERMTCPMAKAPWLQAQGKTQNPYYGKAMQTCGEVQK